MQLINGFYSNQDIGIDHAYGIWPRNITSMPLCLLSIDHIAILLLTGLVLHFHNPLGYNILPGYSLTHPTWHKDPIKYNYISLLLLLSQVGHIDIEECLDV